MSQMSLLVMKPLSKTESARFVSKVYYLLPEALLFRTYLSTCYKYNYDINVCEGLWFCGRALAVVINLT